MDDAAREQINDLIMMLLNEFGQKAVKLPGVDAVCITLVSGKSYIPLGGIVIDPQHQTFTTIVRAISKCSDQIDILTQMLLTEDSVGQQNSVGLGPKEEMQHQSDTDANQHDPESPDAPTPEPEPESQPG